MLTPLPSIELGTQPEATGVLFPVRHVRVATTGIASLVRAVGDFTRPDGSVSRNRTAARAAWSVASAHTYGYSISPEDGAIAGVTAELVRRSLGSSGDATAVTADGRVYFPALAAHHVFALRLAGGASSGPLGIASAFGSINFGFRSAPGCSMS